MRAWIALAFGGAQNPYGDEAGVSYGFDDHVQNHKQVQPDDLLFVRDRNALVGIGKITRIDEAMAEKAFSRCPVCDSANLYQRKTATPHYRCSNGHEFESPNVLNREVKVFRAFFEGNYVTVGGRVSAQELRPFQLRGSTQLAIMPCDLEGIAPYIARHVPAVASYLLQWAMVSTRSFSDVEADETSPSLTPEGLDFRTTIIRGLRLRRGQRAFRESLLTRYGACCAISGCNVLAVLEAAHIRPYRGPGDNHASNGLLLRSDLHVLFDLDRIGIDPASLTVSLEESLLSSEYASLQGQKLGFAFRLRPDPGALLARWTGFLHGKPNYAS